MSGPDSTNETLNRTLLYVTNLLETHEISKWFVSYSTLLGILRQGRCIEGADCVEIMCDKQSCESLKVALTDGGLHLDMQHFPRLIKAEADIERSLSTVKFFMAEVYDGNFYDTWTHTTWENCNELKEFKWYLGIVNIPNMSNFVKNSTLTFS